MRRTKIVCTIGPATSSEKMIKRLIEAGMDVARLNFSHGSYDEHAHVIRIIRQVAGPLNRPIALLQDLQGPKLRVGKMKNGSVQLQTGAHVTIVVQDCLGTADQISTSYADLPRDIQPGDRILLDDGLILLRVEKVDDDRVICRVEEGGVLSDHKGINLPNVAISQPSLTEKDRADLSFGIEQGVDWVAMSFVRKPSDITVVKDIIREHGSDIKVVAKLEKPEAINQLDEIIREADGVMVARGDLGVELPLETVPPLQKRIIRLARHMGKPVITATQMLESMKVHARPTRAEVSDVANAIFDGTDAVMLSAETAVGEYPVVTVETMSRIIEAAEADDVDSKVTHYLDTSDCRSIPDAISYSACDASDKLGAKAIVTFTTSGFTALMVARHRPATNIIACTPSELVRYQLNLSWGVIPMHMDLLASTDEIVTATEKMLLEKKFVKRGDVVIILLGAPLYIKGTTNLMKIHVIGEAES
ncbi:pyruvate kinase [candidate division KSB1 bacterium]|nr:pyruvate kinase [candidate division KSB1 bacterium]